MEVDFAMKEATVHYDPEKARILVSLSRLKKWNDRKYAESTITSLSAELDGEYAKVTARAEVKKKGEKATLEIVIEPKEGHALNGDGQPELEIEAKAAKGTTFKDPVLKDKKGVSKKPRDFAIDFDVSDKAPSGELVVGLEVRLVDVKGKEKTPRIVQLAVPILVP